MADDFGVCKERNGIADVFLPVCHVGREGGETLTIHAPTS